MFLINALKAVINFLSAPQYLVTAMLILLVFGIRWRPLWTKKGGLFLLVLGTGAIGLSYLDPNFAAVATLPDNVPIVGMIFLVGFFFWYAMHHAYENDRRIAAGLPTVEGQDSAQKVFSWPDLVYVELILPRRRDGRHDRLVDLSQGPAGGAGQSDGFAQPRQGALVLPGPPGDARLLRPLARRRRPALAHHRRADGHSLHRRQPEGERLLHFQGAPLGDHDLPRRVYRPLVHADRARDRLRGPTGTLRAL